MLIVKSYVDLIKNNEVIWKEKNSVRLSHLGVIYFKDNKWPKAFECEESWDAHFCDSWHEINKDEIISYLKKEIEANKETLEKIDERVEEYRHKLTKEVKNALEENTELLELINKKSIDK